MEQRWGTYPTLARPAPKISSPARFITAPTNAPPLLAPSQTSLSFFVQPSLMRYRPHSSKSANATGLFSRTAALCQSSPNSPPPRIFATQYKPPVWVNIAATVGEKAGSMEILKPPYLLVSYGIRRLATRRENRKSHRF